MACCLVAGHMVQGKATALASQAVRFSRRNFRQHQQQLQHSTKQQPITRSLRVTAARCPRYSFYSGGEGAVLCVHVTNVSMPAGTPICIGPTACTRRGSVSQWPRVRPIGMARACLHHLHNPFKSQEQLCRFYSFDWQTTVAP